MRPISKNLLRSARNAEDFVTYYTEDARDACGVDSDTVQRIREASKLLTLANQEVGTEELHWISEQLGTSFSSYAEILNEFVGSLSRIVVWNGVVYKTSIGHADAFKLHPEQMRNLGTKNVSMLPIDEKLTYLVDRCDKGTFALAEIETNLTRLDSQGNPILATVDHIGCINLLFTNGFKEAEIRNMLKHGVKMELNVQDTTDTRRTLYVETIEQGRDDAVWPYFLGTFLYRGN